MNQRKVILMQPLEEMRTQTPEIPLTRKEAEQYLHKHYGHAGSVTAKTLAKLATVGGGPVFQRFGRRVGYYPIDLDCWVSSRTSARLNSTSDIGAVSEL